MTVPRTVAALRRGREALCAVQSQLDTLLALGRDPSGVPDADAPERLAGATREAGAALARLAELQRLLAS